ncbi:MAG: hypothetical protein HS108_14390 [Planctomycetes bacterium]|nr:hypothetical protein [Planctomycetota bacterium]
MPEPYFLILKLVAVVVVLSAVLVAARIVIRMRHRGIKYQDALASARAGEGRFIVNRTTGYSGVLWWWANPLVDEGVGDEETNAQAAIHTGRAVPVHHASQAQVDSLLADKEVSDRVVVLEHEAFLDFS